MNRRHTWVPVAGLLIGQDVLSAQVPQPPVRLWSVSVAAGGGSGKSPGLCPAATVVRNGFL